jgi:restriction system protein
MMWSVRAGEKGRLFEQFNIKNMIAVGWKELGDLSAVNSSDILRELMAKTYVQEKKG